MLFIILLYKTIFFCAAAIALRGTLPRYRFDQLLQLTWKNFIFIWLGFIVLNIDLLFFFNILPFFDINHYFNAWILNYLNVENLGFKKSLNIAQPAVTAVMDSRDSLKNQNQADTEDLSSTIEIKSNETVPLSLDDTVVVKASVEALDNSKNVESEATNNVEEPEVINAELSYSFENVRDVFSFCEKELIETCVEAYTNKNFNLPVAYESKDSSLEDLENKKKEMISWLLTIKKADEVHLFIKAIKACCWDLTKEHYVESTQTFKSIVDPIEFFKILTYSEYSDLFKQKMLETLKILRKSEETIARIKDGSLIEELRSQSEFGQRLREIQEPK